MITHVAVILHGSRQDVSFHAQGERAQPTPWKWPRVGIADLKFGWSWLNISLWMTLYDFVPFRAFFPFFSKSQKLSSVKTGANRVPDKLSGACRPEISVAPSFALFAQINQNCSCSLHGKSITNRGLLGHRATLGMIQLIYVGHESWRRSIAGLGRNPKAAVYIIYISIAFVWVKVHNESICRRVPP